MLEFYFIIGCTLFLEAIGVAAADICQYGYSTSYYSGYGTYYSTYCEYGCCGNKYSSYSDVCCVQNLGGVIAGAVIGSLVGIAILIGLIVFCCVAANNSKRRTGTVIQPSNPTTHTFVVSNTAVTQGPSTIPGPYGGPSTIPGPYGHVSYGYPGGFPPPPAYSQYNNMPPGNTDPAYPPPPAAAKY